MNDLIDRILFAMALDSGDIPDEVITYYLNEWQTVYPNSECLVLHNTVVSLYEWLIRDASKSATGGGKIKEREGDVEIEEDEVNKAVDWESALTSYLDSPWSAFPSCREELGKGISGRIKVGGVDETEIDRVKCGIDVRDGQASEISGVRQRDPYRNFYTRKGLRYTTRWRCRR